MGVYARSMDFNCARERSDPATQPINALSRLRPISGGFGGLAALMVSAAVGGCGDEPAKGEGPRAALDAYLEADRTRDADAYCAALTDESQRLVARDTGRVEGFPPGAGCREVLKVRFDDASEPSDYAVAGKVLRSRVGSARAIFVVSSPMLRDRGQRLAISLVKRDGEWKVDLPRGGIKPRPSD